MVRISKCSSRMIEDSRQLVIMRQLNLKFLDRVRERNRTKGVSKQWGDVVALSPSDLDIPNGSFTVFLGPSGCGKTTTLRLIAGLDTATAGKITIGGRDVTHEPPSKRGVAMVFQNYALFPHLSVADNALYSACKCAVHLGRSNLIASLAYWLYLDWNGCETVNRHSFPVGSSNASHLHAR